MKNALPQADLSSQVKWTSQKKPGSQLEVEAIISKDLIASNREKAVKVLAKSMSFPGFRKGKVPEFIIVQKFPKELQSQWEECVVHEALQICMQQVEEKPLDKEKVGYKVKSFSPEEAVVTFFYEVAPTIPHINPADFKLKEVKRPAVDESKVKETIRQVLFFYATWAPAGDKPVEEGSFVTLDVDLLETNPPSPLFANTRFEVTDASMAKWMKDLLIGKKVGDSVEGVSVPDESVDAAEKEAFKPQKVRLTIRNMEQPTLPELTPELLKNLGVESEEDLKKKVHVLLEKQADDHVKEEQRAQVKDFLLAQYPFDLPTSLIHNEVRFRVTQLNQNQEFLDHWVSLSKEEQQRTIEMIRTQSEKAVRLFHLCNQLLQDKGISPSSMSLPPAPETQLEALLTPYDGAAHHQSPDLRRAETISKLILDEAENYIIAQATGNVIG